MSNFIYKSLKMWLTEKTQKQGHSRVGRYLWTKFFDTEPSKLKGDLLKLI